MARWTASAKWAAGPALDGQRDVPLALRLSEGLDATRHGLRVKPYAKGLGHFEDGGETWISLGAESAVKALAAEARVLGYL